MTDLERPSDRRAAYERDGFLLVPGLVPTEEAAALLAEAHGLASAERGSAIARYVQRQYGRGGGLRIVKISQLTRRAPRFQALAHSEPIVDVVEQLLGPGARLFRDVVIGKPAHTGGRFSYHQDSAYWDIEPMALVSAWVALADAPEEAGCLQVVPGSHHALSRHRLVLRERLVVPAAVSDMLRRAVSRAGTGDNPGGAGGNPRLWRAKSLVLSSATRLAPILGDLQDFRILPAEMEGHATQLIPMRAGDVLFFHSLLIHGSGPNRSNADRYGDIITYAPEHAHFVGRGDADLPLARLSRAA